MLDNEFTWLSQNRRPSGIGLGVIHIMMFTRFYPSPHYCVSILSICYCLICLSNLSIFDCDTQRKKSVTCGRNWRSMAYRCHLLVKLEASSLVNFQWMKLHVSQLIKMQNGIPKSLQNYRIIELQRTSRIIQSQPPAQSRKFTTWEENKSCLSLDLHVPSTSYHVLK